MPVTPRLSGGAVSLAVALAFAVPFQNFASALVTPALASKPNEGAEGAHDGHHKADNLSSDAKLYRDVELIRGHLNVAGELIAEGHWIDAVPHVFHPIEEIYGSMKGEIEKRKLPGFLPEMKALAQTVKAKQKDAYEASLKTVAAKLDAVEAALKSSPSWAATIKDAAIATLETAAEEYEEAVKDGKIAEAVEYQDSRGFVWRVEAMLKSDALSKSDANKAALSEAQKALDDLKAAWPAAMPPEKSVMSAAAVEQSTEKIGKLLASMQLAAQ